MLYPEKIKYIEVTQTGSPIGRQGYQRINLIGLGLNKIGRTRKVLNNQSTAGMINKVKHLVTTNPLEK